MKSTILCVLVAMVFGIVAVHSKCWPNYGEVAKNKPKVCAIAFNFCIRNAYANYQRYSCVQCKAECLKNCCNIYKNIKNIGELMQAGTITDDFDHHKRIDEDMSSWFREGWMKNNITILCFVLRLELFAFHIKSFSNFLLSIYVFIIF